MQDFHAARIGMVTTLIILGISNPHVACDTLPGGGGVMGTPYDIRYRRCANI